MISYPFDSEITGYTDNGLPQFDRAIDADNFRDFTKTFYTNGVRADSSDFLVAASTGMNITVEPGKGVVEGVIFNEDKKRTLAIQASESLDRIDTVVIRLDNLQRNVDLYVVKGTAASSPIRPKLNRPVLGESGDYYELGIADIFVAKNSTDIAQHRITDTRLDNERCGVIASAILELNTTKYYEQFQSALDEYLETVNAAIDGTLAGQLESKIRSTTKTITIQPEEWQEGIYTLNDPLITATSNQEWMPPLNVSKEALEILQSANIIDYSQSTGQAQIKCLGDIPTVAVTLRVCFRGDK